MQKNPYQPAGSAVTLVAPSQLTGSSIEKTLARFAHWIPTQRPIYEFIHHPTLHGFLEYPFHEGIQLGSQLFGAKTYLALAEYQKLFSEGKITPSAIDRALRENISDADEQKRFFDLMKQPPGRSEVYFPSVLDRGMRREWQVQYGIDLDCRVEPLLFRLVNRFLDQGIAEWRFPHTHLSFFEATAALVKESLLPLRPLTDPLCRELLELPPADAIPFCLKLLVEDPARREPYCLELMVSQKGWVGTIHEIEFQPELLLSRRAISVLEYVALELIIEVGWLKRLLKNEFKPIRASSLEGPRSFPEWQPVGAREELKKIWHEAYEWSFHERSLKAIKLHIPGPEKINDRALQSVQTIHCIDDRECSLRRHFEELDGTIETFGTAGFFGLDFAFQGADDKVAAPFCPVVLKPKHLVRSTRHEYAPKNRPSYFRKWLVTQFWGLVTALRIFRDNFFPSLGEGSASSLRRLPLDYRLQILRDRDEKTESGLHVGFSHPEMVEKLFKTLRDMGLTENFAPLVILIGHGSSSTNNPYFAAYDCGACAGKPGSPNALAFANMANLPEVRAGLRHQGISIPDTTYFLGGLHDTTRDEITLFEESDVPASLQGRLKKFRQVMEKALEINAKERTRRFLNVPSTISIPAAAREVKRRSAALFETRPELNHANNALSIVGRRSFTKGLFFDRRAFLNSYNPFTDPQGEILAEILSAVVPVCGGINLEYFHSRIDNAVYGAGTKLAHNVFGLIAVANGVEGDLQLGLPTQMVELHEPLRLLIIVEQEPEIALAAARKQPAIYAWIEKGWVKYACVSPQSHRTYIFCAGTMAELDLSEVSAPSRLESSLNFVLHPELTDDVYWLVGVEGVSP